MILNLPQINPYLFLALILAGVLFGVSFNWLTTQLNRRGYSEGYASGLVIVGVLFTLALSVPVIGIVNAAAILVLFVATGLPMAAGDFWRNASNRRRDQGGD